MLSNLLKPLHRLPLNKTFGFTIVELLVVIVVIGILAAIVIVMYNGVQQRSSNTQLIAGVNQYKKIIDEYVATNGKPPLIDSLPAPTGSSNATLNYYCLGTGYTNGKCANYSDFGDVSESSSLCASLNQFTTCPFKSVTSRTGSLNVVRSDGLGSLSVFAAVYKNIKTSDGSVYYAIEYVLKGKDSCKISGADETSTVNDIGTDCQIIVGPIK